MGVPASGSRSELTRVLRLWDSVAVVAGITIGSGIFLTPSTIVQNVGSLATVLALWIAGGLLSLFAALSFAELAAAWPRTGGPFVYFRECFGPRVSFLFGWTQLIGVRPSAIAALAAAFSEYVQYFLPLSRTGQQFVALTAIVAVSLINYLGVRLSSNIQNLFTALKVILLLGMVAAGLWAAGTLDWSQTWTTTASSGGVSSWGAFGTALAAIFWTYDGWVDLTNVAGEVKDPGRTVPRATAISLLGILVLYVLVNLVYVKILTPAGVADSPRVASEAMTALWGSWGGALVAFAVLISTFGALNGGTLTGPRIFFAMAVDGQFFSWAKRIDPKRGTPSTAIVLQSVLSLPLVLLWNFDQLARYFVFVSFIFYALGVVALFRLRSRKDKPAYSYRMWGYPWTPLLFLIFAAGLLGAMLVSAFDQALVGGGIVLAGVPAYGLWKWLRGRRGPQPAER